MKCFKWLGVLTLLIVASQVVHATCVPPVAQAYGVSGNISYEQMYSTGPNNACITSYVDRNGNSQFWGNVATFGASTDTFNGTLNYQHFLVGTSSVVYIQVAGTQITPLTSYLVLGASLTANDLALTATPTISTSPVLGSQTQYADGQWLVVSGTSSVSAIDLQDNGSLSGSQLFLGSATNGVRLPFVAVSSTMTRVFQYNAYNKGWNLIH